MRWYWIDRFTEFESGRHAKAVKNVSLAEEHLHDHFPWHPIMPTSLIVEGMAQTGGLLVCEHGHFREKVILAKIPHARFYFDVQPGDTLTYTATIQVVKPDGAMVSAVSHKGDQLQGEMEIVFAHLGDQSLSLFHPETYLRMMRILGAFEVGHAADGSPLRPPAHLLEAVENAEPPLGL